MTLSAADAVVVVPSITVDDLLVRCVEACIRDEPDTVVVVVVDDDTGADRLPSDVVVVRSDDPGIAAKRNLGVRISASHHVAFIDSDAYPATGWLSHAVGLLERDASLGAVGGPNVSPAGQTGWEWAVGRAHRSWLVDGWWRFRKDPHAAARDVGNLPSCNLVVRRLDYEALGGMNEDLFTAEDTDFCTRLVSSGRRIRFTPEVLVYHKDRDLGSFAVQRFTFGVAMVPLLRRASIADPPYVAVSAAIAGFTSFMVLGPLGFRSRAVRRAWWFTAGAYTVAVTTEAVRLTRGSGGAVRVAAALVIGNLAPGAGLVAEALGLSPDLAGLYRNDR